MLQAMLGNSGWLFLDKLVRIGIGLVVGVWLARYLGPERFGQFNFAIAFVALFSPIAILGLDGLVVRELVSRPEYKQEILGSAFAMKLAGGLLAFVLALLAILTIHARDQAGQWLVGVIAAGMILQAFDVADLWFQSKVQSRYSVLAKNGAFLTLTIAKVWLILSEAELIAFAWVSTAEIALGALG
ncbi:MAG: flippase, partial [Rhodocyclaceae bacterium]